MGAERLQHIPDVLEGGVVERLLGVGVLVDEHRDHDGADLLVGGLADRPPEGLDDVDGRAARVDEGDAVEGRHIDALAEAAGVAEQAALVRRRSLAEAQQAAGRAGRCVIVPETCSLQRLPEGRELRGIQAITAGISAAELAGRSDPASGRRRSAAGRTCASSWPARSGRPGCGRR